MASKVISPAGARSGSGDRWYTLELRHRPALYGDIGNLLKIQGLVVGGEGAQAILLMPDTPVLRAGFEVHALTPEQWTDFLQRSDDPEVLVMPEKAFHRKLRYEISGFVQQKVWKADGLKCMYCRRSMGEVQLTIDHFIPLELGGANDTSNYLTACRKCNKDKGGMDPRDWCNPLINGRNPDGTRRATTYEFYVQYLTERKVV